MTPHAPRLAVVSRTIDELIAGHFLRDVDDTNAVVSAVIKRLGTTMPSERSRELARGTVLVELQRRDLIEGRDPGLRLVEVGDATLIEESLRNADDQQHDLFDDR